MSIQTTPTLLKLAAKCLLRDQALTIAALEYLPAELFPDLLVLAYRSGHHCKLLKAMAQAWPFTVLPLGILMQRPPDHAPPRAMALKAVFDALDVLLTQERVLDKVKLDCIQEVEVNCTWDLPTLGTFALYLGQMSNLQRLSLPHTNVLSEEDEDEEQGEEGEEEQHEEEQEVREEEELEREEQEWQEEEEQEWERQEEELEREEQEWERQEEELEREEQEWERQEEELEREEQEWERQEEELEREEQEWERQEEELEREEQEWERQEEELEREEQEWERQEEELEREEQEWERQEEELEREEQEWQEEEEQEWERQEEELEREEQEWERQEEELEREEQEWERQEEELEREEQEWERQEEELEREEQEWQEEEEQERERREEELEREEQEWERQEEELEREEQEWERQEEELEREEQEWQEEEEQERERREEELEREEQEWERQEEELEREEQEWQEEEELEREEQEWERQEEELEREEQEWERQEEELEREEQEWERQEEELEREEQEWERQEEELEREEQEWQEEEEQEQEKQRSFSQFLSQVIRLRHLRELDVCSLSFRRGRLDQMLRVQCSAWQVRTGSSGDVVNLSQPKRRLGVLTAGLHQIVKTALGLGKSIFCHLQDPVYRLPPSLGTNPSVSPVAPTLQDLGLNNCAMADSQVEAILPALSRCHQLRDFTIPKNNFSMATVEKLLRHTAGLRSLELELYPVPLECYRTQGTVDQERVALIQAELTGTLRDLGQPRTIHLATKRCRDIEFYHVAFS
uniref:Uncharacterized protein n=1 Tax=Myotis myotis TaxID=51298 RepID=A0A7J7WHQ5_MYOMY|nr:hypothetical protein mMyoMyo1_012154 [Myotis myotis]